MQIGSHILLYDLAIIKLEILLWPLLEEVVLDLLSTRIEEGNFGS